MMDAAAAQKARAELDSHFAEAYRRELKREEDIRDSSFFDDYAYRIGGVQIRAMNIRDMVILQEAGNAFFCGSEPGKSDVAMLIWRLLPVGSRNPGQKKFLRLLTRKFADEFAWTEARQDAATFVRAMVLDIPSGGSGENWKVSAMASVVHQIAKAYGWGEEAILALPLPRLWQYLRMIRYDDRSEAGQKVTPELTPADKVRGDYLAAINKLNSPEK